MPDLLLHSCCVGEPTHEDTVADNLACCMSSAPAIVLQYCVYTSNSCTHTLGRSPLMRTLLQATSHVARAQLLHSAATPFIQPTLTFIPCWGSIMRTMLQANSPMSYVLQYCIYTCDSSTHTLWGNPLMRTLLRASSHMSHELNFQTCAAILYSSIRGSCNIDIPHSKHQNIREV
jgi:hypothetical protein